METYTPEQQAFLDARGTLTDAEIYAQEAERNALPTQAEALLADFIAHAALPVEDRDQVAATSLDTRAGALMLDALGSTDPTVVGLTAKITALGLRLTRERADYQGGLL